MPIYEYQCTSCNHCFEQKQGFDADPINTCPLCHSPARRLFKPTPIIFKGSGFYVTDYNGKSPRTNEEEPSKTKEAEPAKPGSAETKAQTTADE